MIPRRRALASLLPALMEQSPATGDKTARLVLGGDLMLARHVYQAAQQRKDAAFPFRAIAEHLASADLAFANLESPFSERGPYFENRMVFRAHPSMIAGLVLAGIDVVSTANNHARDAGPEGLAFTIAHLRAHGILPAGTANEPAIAGRKGLRFGFLAYTFDQRNGNTRTDDARVAMMDIGRMQPEVERLRQACDLVVVSMHAGWEYHPRPNPMQIRFARAAIEAGARIVAGHHPHVFQPVEPYQNGLIFYSLGNLVFDQTHRAGVRQGVVADVFLKNSVVERYELREVILRGGAASLGPAWAP